MYVQPCLKKICYYFHMSQEDIFSSHFSIYICVFSFITNYFHKFKPICLFKSLRKHELSYFQSGGYKSATKTFNYITIFVWKEVYVVGQVDATWKYGYFTHGKPSNRERGSAH